MRVTDKMGYNQVTTNLQKNRLEISELQNQAATQKRINKPSDDPIAAARVLGSKTEEKMNKQFLKNIDIARSFLEASDQSLGELTENLIRAKELAIQSANDSGGGAETRRITALEIEQIHNQAVQIGNRKLGERYIFAGYKTTTQPFNRFGEYKGDEGEMKIQINKDGYLSMNVPGSKLLLGKGLSADGVINGSTETPKNVEDLRSYKQKVQQIEGQKVETDPEPINIRGPASERDRTPIYQDEDYTKTDDYESSGINVLKTLKDLEIALKVNDKESIQDSIDNLDQAIAQVVHARAQVGSRVSTLNSNFEALQKFVIDNKITSSQLEDADLFQVVSDMQKSDSTLKATLETSGKVIQPSLMDFLK
jgi:flagellar hook-associated protein 3 FlgL